MWGVELGKTMLENVGFQQITVEEIPFYELNILYKARKILSEDNDSVPSSPNVGNITTSAFRRLSMKLHNS